jgi:hypothetical protein
MNCGKKPLCGARGDRKNAETKKAAAGASRGGFAFGGQLQKQTTAVSGGRFLENIVLRRSVLGRPGSDLLFQVLRLSTIGAGEFYGRVRDGIGYRPPAKTTSPAKDV